ncbi:MAG: biotin transporter BioY [Gemmatimonadetes bacterium]|nr:biotin transporter BioY [Gemmatimonadota bacterium]
MTTQVLAARSRSDSSTLALRLSTAAAFAAATALAAQVQIPLPFTPVPVTLQTAVVLLAGGVLGGGWGAASMAMYLLAGSIGAPVFAGAESGPGVLLGATGGYLLAFLLVPPIVARSLPSRGGALRAFAVLLAVSTIVFAWGMLQLAWVLDVPLGRAFLLGVAPFLAGDLVKVAAATAAFRAARPWVARLRD